MKYKGRRTGGFLQLIGSSGCRWGCGTKLCLCLVPTHPCWRGPAPAPRAARRGRPWGWAPAGLEPREKEPSGPARGSQLDSDTALVPPFLLAHSLCLSTAHLHLAKSQGGWHCPRAMVEQGGSDTSSWGLGRREGALLPPSASVSSGAWLVLAFPLPFFLFKMAFLCCADK